MTRRLRIWMTGCLAVVLAAVGGELVRPAAERMATVRQSRYDADETLRKIERAAHGHGYTIFARVSAPEAETATRSYALVLGVDEGVTPVVVDEAGNKIAQQDDAIPRGSTPVRRALPLPKNLAPGKYSLELVAYHRADGSPLTMPNGTPSLSLAEITVAP